MWVFWWWTTTIFYHHNCCRWWLCVQLVFFWVPSLNVVKCFTQLDVTPLVFILPCSSSSSQWLWRWVQCVLSVINKLLFMFGVYHLVSFQFKSCSINIHVFRNKTSASCCACCSSRSWRRCGTPSRSSPSRARWSSPWRAARPASPASRPMTAWSRPAAAAVGAAAAAPPRDSPSSPTTEWIVFWELLQLFYSFIV